jgi:predicted RNase H-like HicB family nuclease
MAKYVYPAIFTPEENGMYSVRFPDIDGCFTCGDSLSDTMESAEDALCLMIYDKEETGVNIPSPSNIKDVQTNGDEFVSLVSCDTLEYRKMFHSKAIKKTLTIPAWLNTTAEKQGVNFSQVLQDALIEKLDLN